MVIYRVWLVSFGERLINPKSVDLGLFSGVVESVALLYVTGKRLTNLGHLW